MSPHPETIMAEIQAEIHDLFGSVSGPATRGLPAAEVERALWRRLRALGARLLELHFASRAAEPVTEPVRGPDGTELRPHDWRERDYYSVFGKVAIRRRSYTAPGQPVVCPLDAALGLPGRCYSDLLREWATYGAVGASYGATCGLLERILELELSGQALETAVAEDAADVTAFYEQPPEPPAADAAETILVAQADGKGVPLVRPPAAARPERSKRGPQPGTKKEAIVTAVYTIAPYQRTPADVLAALLRRPAPADSARGTRPAPVGKEVRATLAGKDAALAQLAARAAQHDGAPIGARVALTDGADALQRAVRAHLPDFTLVLDIIHAAERLWEVANALLGERHPDRTAWVAERLELLLTGQVAAVSAELAERASDPTLARAQRDDCRRAAEYYQHNADHMRYPDYLARGWPIGTGVVEGACGHLVADRCELAGMRWTPQGAQPVLALRAVRLNGHWDAYWDFHRRQDQTRRYGSARPTADPPEACLAEAA